MNVKNFRPEKLDEAEKLITAHMESKIAFDALYEAAIKASSSKAVYEKMFGDDVDEKTKKEFLEATKEAQKSFEFSTIADNISTIEAYIASKDAALKAIHAMEKLEHVYKFLFIMKER